MGNNLAKIRGKHQIKQQELAKEIGVTKQGLHFGERNRLSAKLALKAADVLDENVFEILGSDVLVLLPKTEEDKKIIIKMIEEL